MADEEKTPEKRVKKNNNLSAAARLMGHFAGIRGGPARDAALSHTEKSAISRLGGLARAAHMKGKKKHIIKKLKKDKPE